MVLEPVLLRNSAHRLDKPRLTDSCFAANVDDLTLAPAQAAAEHTAKLLQLGLASHEGTARASRRLDRKACQPPDPDGLSMPLKLRVPMASHCP